jgi:hypothetical protein
MLRKYFEYRERKLYGRDTNRRTAEFEWGLDQIGVAADHDPHSAFRDFVSQALADSDSFYACGPAPHYEFDGKIVTFPSAVETCYPENNTVWGRFFRSDGDLAVIILPQWNCAWDAQIKLCRMLQRSGISSLRLSMPYHHHRKPPHLERSDYLVSSNIGRTLMAARQAVLDTRRAADWLLETHRRVGLIGTSIGSCIGFLALAHDTRFSTAAFIHVSSYFADVVWHGLSTKHVRRSLEGAIDLDQLRFFWSAISPYPFIQRLNGDKRRMLMLSGRYDLSFLPELSSQVYSEFERCGLRYEATWMPCGHYTMGELPFSVMAAYRILRFLKQERNRGS